MYKNIFKSIVLLSSFQAVAQQTPNDVSENYFTENDTVKKLKEVVPRALFSIALQAAVWGKVVAREDLSAMRKDVTAKLYGWDITRKRKLLDKQKEWKKKMKQFWKVNLPSEAFVNLLKK